MKERRTTFNLRLYKCRWSDLTERQQVNMQQLFQSVLTSVQSLQLSQQLLTILMTGKDA